MEFNKVASIIKIIYLLIISYVSNSTLEEVRNSLKEVAYSYYMRGKYIQYNSFKRSSCSPEEATNQNINYLVCSFFAKAVYRDLLNITLPTPTESLINYAKKNIGNPEVIVYSNISVDKIPQMFVYDQNEKNKYKLIKNFLI